MKKVVMMMIAVWAICLLQTGFALDGEVIMTDSSFTFDAATMLPDGTFLLGGDNIDGSMIYKFDPHDKTLEEIFSSTEESMKGRGFNDLSWNSDTSDIVFLLYGGIGSDASTWDTEIILTSANGDLLYLFDDYQAYAVCAIGNQIVYSYTYNGFTSGVKCITDDQQIVWDIQFDKWVQYHKILPYYSGVLCVGNYYADHDSSPQGVITAISQYGGVEWSYITDDFIEFSDCTILDDGSVVVVGDTKNPNENEESSYVACVDQNGVRWESRRNYGIGSLKSSAILLSNGHILYICAQLRPGISPKELWLIAFDKGGTFISDEMIEIGDILTISHFECYQYQEYIYLLISGRNDSKEHITELITIE